MPQNATLADNFLASELSWEEELYTMPGSKIKQVMRDARRFVFDTKGCIALAKISSEMSDFVSDNLEFCIPPYEKMYIELSDYRSYFQTVNPDLEYFDGTADTRNGYLIDNGTVYLLSQNKVRGSCLLPIAYEIGVEWQNEDIRQFCQKFNFELEYIPRFMWTTRRMKDISLSQVANIFRHVKARAIFKPVSQKFTRAMHDVIEASAGDAALVMTILLLLNRPGATQIEKQVENGRGIIGRKPARFFSHSVVTINIDNAKTILRSSARSIDPSPRVRHEVRGHFCHSHKHGNNLCAHDWQKDGERQWTCVQCDARRWWRSECVRGSSLEGFSLKDYRITKRKQNE